MKLVVHKPWAGHFALVLVVKKWRPWFMRFNQRFARVDRFLELAILDGGFFEGLPR